MESGSRGPAAPEETGARIIDLRAPEIVEVHGEATVDSRGVPDYRPLQAAAARAVAQARPGQLVLVTNAPYVGATAELVADPLIARGLVPGQDVFVAARSVGPAFTVIGGVTRDCTRRALLWLPGSKGAPAPVSSPAAAELIGLAGAAFTATRQALEWELARLCRRFSLDEGEVLEAAELIRGEATGAAALAWQARAIEATPVLDAATTALRGQARELAGRAAEALGSVGKSLAWARVLVLRGEDARLALEVTELLHHAGAELVELDPARPRPVECDLVVQLGTETPWVADGCYPLFLGATGQVGTGAEL